MVTSKTSHRFLSFNKDVCHWHTSSCNHFTSITWALHVSSCCIMYCRKKLAASVPAVWEIFVFWLCIFSFWSHNLRPPHSANRFSGISKGKLKSFTWLTCHHSTVWVATTGLKKACTFSHHVHDIITLAWEEDKATFQRKHNQCHAQRLD